jgi:hypothetical protein
VLIAAFVSILGFNLTFPFLPLYVQELGVSDPGRAAFWSGVIGSSPVCSPLSLPRSGARSPTGAAGGRCCCAPPPAQRSGWW